MLCKQNKKCFALGKLSRDIRRTVAQRSLIPYPFSAGRWFDSQLDVSVVYVKLYKRVALQTGGIFFGGKIFSKMT